MTLEIAEILKNSGIKHFGFCSFDLLENDYFECRAKTRIPKGTKSVIVCIFPYKVKEELPNKISRYSAVGDYHEICGKILKNTKEKLKQKFKENCFEYFIDNSPIKEVKAAAYAGLGVIGKNNLLITKEYGSYVFIGEILTDLKLPIVNNNITNCIDCNKCIEACPTGFLSFKENKCLSAITQQKQELTHKEKNLIKENKTVWGCDICQNVCPMNEKTKITYISEFINSYKNEYIKNENITGRAYAWRGEKVIKRNYELIKTEKNN